MSAKSLRAKSIRSAMFEVQAVMDTLDVSSSLCESCCARTYNNWPDYKVFQALSSAMTRLKTAYVSQSVEGQPGELEDLLGPL